MNGISKEEKQKYKALEPILESINRDYINALDREYEPVNQHLKTIIQEIENAMKDVSPLFKQIFTTVLWSGSYYEGLKVHLPEEFDLDFKFKLPFNVNSYKVTTKDCRPGFIRVQILEERQVLVKRQPAYKEIANWLSADGFLNPIKFKSWFQSVADKAIQQLQPNWHSRYEISRTSSGPAYTLLVDVIGSNLSFDVDLVPVIEMNHSCWPLSPIKPAPAGVPPESYLIVPKIHPEQVPKHDQLWRLSFYNQEKSILNGCGAYKASLKLLKSLRDANRYDKIASYYIKTIFLNSRKEFQNNLPLSYVFMTMLLKFRDALKQGIIKYYWSDNFNLLSAIKKETLTNHANNLDRIVNEIEKMYQVCPMILVLYIIPKDDYQPFISKYANSLNYIERQMLLKPQKKNLNAPDYREPIREKKTSVSSEDSWEKLPESSAVNSENFDQGVESRGLCIIL